MIVQPLQVAGCHTGVPQPTNSVPISGRAQQTQCRLAPLARARPILEHAEFAIGRCILYRMPGTRVSPDHRGGGIGGLMMTALQQQAKQNDWVRLYWLTAGDNQAAQRLYDRLTNRDDSVLYKIDTV